MALDTMKYIMDELEHPEKNLKFIHIAGTNGKGSCCEIITNILINAGYKVGKFISPHLIKYNERISIQNECISDYEFETLKERVEPIINNYNLKHECSASLFDLFTAIAILYFYEKECDFVVFEAGLGGLNDSTNVINSIVSIITSIGYDHMELLGNTLTKIANQKAGIIKENSDTIFALSEDSNTNAVIEQTCIAKHSKLHIADSKNIQNYLYDNNSQKFDYKKYKNLVINLKGEKQVLNSIIAIECIRILKEKKYIISDEAIYKGLSTVIHKGRFEIINDKPLMVYDGAHNLPAIENFINSVNMYYKDSKKVFVISILNIKDYKAILKAFLAEGDSVFIFTDGSSNKSYFPKEKLLNEAQKYSNNSKLLAMSLEDAIELTYREYNNYAIFFVGTLCVYNIVTDKIKSLK